VRYMRELKRTSLSLSFSFCSAPLMTLRVASLPSYCLILWRRQEL